MELDGERGQYHFNARSYDQKLSRFFAPDLLFEMYPNQSPYSYSANNPVNFKDPSGMVIYSQSNEASMLNQAESFKQERIAFCARLTQERKEADEWLSKSAGSGIGGSGSTVSVGNGIVDQHILTRYKITDISREDSDKLFYQIFNVMVFFSPMSESFGKLGQIMSSFHTIVSTQVGLDMINNIVEKLEGRQITLLGVSRAEMGNIDGGKHSNAYGLTSPTSSKYSINGSLTVRIALDFDAGGIYENNPGFFDSDALPTQGLNEYWHNYTLLFSFAHELGHVEHRLTSFIDFYWKWNSPEEYADKRAWQILSPLGIPTRYKYLYGK